MRASRSETPTTSDRHLPAAVVERLAFEPDGVDAAASSHRDACDACRADVERLLRERDAFLANRPTRPFVAAVTLRAGQGNGSARAASWRAPGWILATGAALAAAVVVVSGRSLAPTGDAVRFKGSGGPVLAVFVSRGGEPALPLGPDGVLHPGDVVRFGVVAPAGGHVVIASVDEEGRMSRYFPQPGTGTAPLEGRPAQQILPGSIVLDETIGREWIVLVLTRTPLEREAVEEALRRAWRERRGGDLGPLALDAETRVVAVTKATP